MLIKFSISTELQEGALGISIGENRPRAQFLAIFQAHPFGSPVMDQNLLDWRVGANHCAMRLGRCRHRKTDTSHAPAHVAPHTMFAVDLAKHVVPMDIHLSRCFGANEGTNDT